jgi:hypothetical protein
MSRLLLNSLISASGFVTVNTLYAPFRVLTVYGGPLGLRQSVLRVKSVSTLDLGPFEVEV